MKLTSRKFWLSVAAFLGSLGISISGVVSQHEVIAAIGIICTMLSAAIYAAMEAWVDKSAINDAMEYYTAITDETAEEIKEGSGNDAAE